MNRTHVERPVLEHAGQRGRPRAVGRSTRVRRTVGDLLRDAVSSHLVSDVPVGAFLSGGIDSSAVVGLMREAGVTPRTFSVGFAERSFDEKRPRGARRKSSPPITRTSASTNTTCWAICRARCGRGSADR
jgi:hypothetical protein